MNDLRGSRWVITGAAGRIGLPLRDALRAEGVALVSLDVRPTPPIDGSDMTMVVDLSDLHGLTGQMRGADGVVHLGGLSDEADFHDLAATNIVGTYHVLEAARRACVPRVVFASSNRVTGMYPTTVLVSADMPSRPDGFYGASKVAGEALCRLYADKFEMQTVAVRIGSYEQQPTDARQRSTWLSPADAVRAFAAAMTTEARQAVFYAVSDNADGWWSQDSGRAIGYHALDDAALWPIDGTLQEPQGGAYASKEYSLDRMTQ